MYRKQIRQNVNNSCLSVESIQMFIVPFFQPFCVREHLHTKRFRGKRIVIFTYCILRPEPN